MKTWKRITASLPQIRKRAIVEDNNNAELLATIRAKAAAYVPSEPIGITVIEGEPSALEMHPNSFVTEAIIHEWRNKDTFAQFAQDVQYNDISFPGREPAVFTAAMLQELELLKRMCKHHLAQNAKPTKRMKTRNVSAWDGVPDAKNFHKQNI